MVQYIVTVEVFFTFSSKKQVLLFKSMNKLKK